MKFIRKYIGWIAGLAVGGFLLWMVGTVISLRTMGSQAAGTLFGHKVPVQEFLQALAAVTHQGVLTYGESFQREIQPQELNQQALRRLILLAEARQRRIHVSDQEVVSDLQSWELFQKNGRFDPPTYEAVLRYSLGVSPRDFEEEHRGNLMIDKLIQQVVGNLTLSDEELREGFRRREEAIQIRFLRLPQEPLAQEVADAARQNPKELPRLAKQLSLPLTTSDFFRRESILPDLGRAVLLEPAFGLQPGEVTGPLETPQGWWVVLLKEKQPADDKKFEETKEALKPEILSQKRLKTYVTWYTELFKKARPQGFLES